MCLYVSERDVGAIFTKYPFNKYLMANVPKPFHVVYPKQQRKKGGSLYPVNTRERQINHHVSHAGVMAPYSTNSFPRFFSTIHSIIEMKVINVAL